MPQLQLSLAALLKKAADETEINQLLRRGEKYEFASGKTQRRWKRLAIARRKALVKK